MFVRTCRGPEAAPEGWDYRLLDCATMRPLGAHLDPNHGYVTPSRDFSRFAIRSLAGTHVWDAATQSVSKLPIAKSAFAYFTSDLTEARWLANDYADKKRQSPGCAVRSWSKGERRARGVALETSAIGCITRYFFARHDAHLVGDRLIAQDFSDRDGHAVVNALPDER